MRERADILSVLLVDDHEVLLKSIARQFEREGIEALKAKTRAEALQALITERPDLAVIDLFLAPPENGLQLLAEIKATEQPPFCIMVSAHMSVAHAVMCMRAGADDVFLKPFTAQQVLDRATQTVRPPELPELRAPTLDQIEWEHIARVLGDYDGNITHAAQALGVLRQSLQRKIKRHAPRVLRPDELPKPE